jgi:hypothetical protein
MIVSGGIFVEGYLAAGAYFIFRRCGEQGNGE